MREITMADMPRIAANKGLAATTLIAAMQFTHDPLTLEALEAEAIALSRAAFRAIKWWIEANEPERVIIASCGVRL